MSGTEDGARETALAFELADIRTQTMRATETANAAFGAVIAAVGAMQVALQVLGRRGVTPEERDALAKADTAIRKASDDLLNHMLEGS